MTRSFSRLAAVLSTVVAAGAVSASLAVAGAAPATAHTTTTQTTTTQTTWPEHSSAPYVDVSLYPTFDLTAASAASGSKFFTLAFVLNTGDVCHAGWSSYTDLDAGFLQDDIASLRASGGDVAISVGGANGQEPASSCTSPEALQAQYQRVIDAYAITHLDFDVEGSSLSDTATVDRRNKAIAGHDVRSGSGLRGPRRHHRTG